MNDAPLFCKLLFAIPFLIGLVYAHCWIVHSFLQQAFRSDGKILTLVGIFGVYPMECVVLSELLSGILGTSAYVLGSIIYLILVIYSVVGLVSNWNCS